MSFFSRLLKTAARVVVGTAVAGVTAGLSAAVGANLRGVGSKVGNSLFGLARNAFGAVANIFNNVRRGGAPASTLGKGAGLPPSIKT